jgi:hypothetical protein
MKSAGNRPRLRFTAWFSALTVTPYMGAKFGCPPVAYVSAPLEMPKHLQKPNGASRFRKTPFGISID